jgi:beta-glucosidase
MKRLGRTALSICAALTLILGIIPAAVAEQVKAVPVAARVKNIITVDGKEFKDLNGNGTLDIYEDWRLSADERAADLLSQMTVREKVSQMQHPTFVPKADGKIPGYLQKWSQEENVGFLLVRELPDVKNAAQTMNQIQEWCESSRLGIPVVVSMDSVHGCSYVTGATVTPHNLGLAATRDTELVRELADVARQEQIAIGTRMTLSPEADIATEPRWGRVMETFGEDVDLVTQMIVAQIEGFQAGRDGLNPDSIIACIKHFPGAGPQMEGVDMAPIVSTEESLQTHLKPYYAAIEANVGSVMPYYSIPMALDTTAALGSKATLVDLLREKMGFDGIIQTDWGMIWAIQQSASLFGEGVSEEEAVIIGVADAKVDGIGGESIRLIDTMVNLMDKGSIPAEGIDESCMRILKAKFELGVFENPYVDVDYAVSYVGNEKNQALSLRAAQESMTLVKNDGVLPLKAEGQILVAGLRAGDMDSLTGGWTSAQPGKTIAQAITDQAGDKATVVYEAEDINKIVELAKQSDVAIVAVGEPSYMHTGPWGPETLELTSSQQEMLEAIKATGTPIVVVAVMGRPYIMTWCDENTSAILCAYYPGSQGGIAIAQTLFGQNNPQGKLPFQMPRNMEQVKAQSSDIAFDMEDPLYDYGFGLSYGTAESAK